MVIKVCWDGWCLCSYEGFRYKSMCSYNQVVEDQVSQSGELKYVGHLYLVFLPGKTFGSSYTSWWLGVGGCHPDSGGFRYVSKWSGTMMSIVVQSLFMFELIVCESEVIQVWPLWYVWESQLSGEYWIEVTFPSVAQLEIIHTRVDVLTDMTTVTGRDQLILLCCLARCFNPRSGTRGLWSVDWKSFAKYTSKNVHRPI